MNYYEAIFLSLIQGLTEFLPISSSGHLAFFQNIFNQMNPNNPEIYENLKNPSNVQLAFNVFVHLGTLFSLIIFYFKDIKNIFKSWLHELNRFQPGDYSRFVCLTIITTLVTALIGIILKKWVHIFYNNLFYLSIMFLIMSFILFSSRFGYNSFNKKIKKKINNKICKIEIARHTADKIEKIIKEKQPFKVNNSDMMNISLKFAIIIGMVQGLAVLPGISRSGITFTTSLFLGMKYHGILKYVMLISIPVLFGVFILEFPVIAKVSFHQIGTYVSAFFISFIVGIISLKVFNIMINQKKIHYFSFYLLFFAFLIYSLSQNV